MRGEGYRASYSDDVISLPSSRRGERGEVGNIAVEEEAAGSSFGVAPTLPGLFLRGDRMPDSADPMPSILVMDPGSLIVCYIIFKP